MTSAAVVGRVRPCRRRAADRSPIDWAYGIDPELKSPINESSPFQVNREAASEVARSSFKALLSLTLVTAILLCQCPKARILFARPCDLTRIPTREEAAQERSSVIDDGRP